MTRLVAAFHILGLAGEIDLCGRWVKLQGEHCWVYVAEPTWRGGYLTWCDDPQEWAVESARPVATRPTPTLVVHSVRFCRFQHRLHGVMLHDMRTCLCRNMPTRMG